MGVRRCFRVASAFHREHSAGTARPRGCARKFQIMAPAFHGEQIAGTARGVRGGFGMVDSGMRRCVGDGDFWKRAIDGRALREGRVAGRVAAAEARIVDGMRGAVRQRQNVHHLFVWTPTLGT
jgi:hypothetical protein